MRATAVCFLFTVFAVFDMTRFNRKRRREFEERMASFEAGSFEEARIAYLSGVATEAQTAMMMEAYRIAQESGVKLSPLLPAPSETTLAEAALGRLRHDNAAADKQETENTGLLTSQVAEVTDDASGTNKAAANGGSKKSWWKVW
jgi:hypothetical protein